MSQTMTIVDAVHSGAPDPASFSTIVTAALSDSARSSGSLESAASTNSQSTNISAPSLDTRQSSSSSAPSTAASSPHPSPCPSILLRSDSYQTFPSRTGSPSPSISFAPLPTTEPRKRHPSHQLGVAARSRLLQHRRMLREQGLDPADYPYPYAAGSGVEGGPGMDDGMGPVEIREAQAGVDAHEDADADPCRRHRSHSDPSEDALPSLGKLMRVAGRSLWKSLSMRDVRTKEREEVATTTAADSPAEGTKQRRSGSLREQQRIAARKAAGHLFNAVDEDRTHSEEGGVWEEEVEQDSWKKLLSGAQVTAEPESIDSEDAPPPAATVHATKR